MRVFVRQNAGKPTDFSVAGYVTDNMGKPQYVIPAKRYVERPFDFVQTPVNPRWPLYFTNALNEAVCDAPASPQARQ